MASKTCKGCNTSKELSEFYRPADGKCKRCVLDRQKERKAELAAGSAKGKRRSAASSGGGTTAPDLTAPRLVMTPGYGFDASIEEGVLRLQQNDTAGNSDTVMLSRSEFRALSAQFAPWCAEVAS